MPTCRDSCLLFTGYSFCGSRGHFYSGYGLYCAVGAVTSLLGRWRKLPVPVALLLTFGILLPFQIGKFACRFDFQQARNHSLRLHRLFPASAKRSSGCAARLHRTRSFSRNRMTHSSCSERRDGKRFWSTAFFPIRMWPMSPAPPSLTIWPEIWQTINAKSSSKWPRRTGFRMC